MLRVDREGGGGGTGGLRGLDFFLPQPSVTPYSLSAAHGLWQPGLIIASASLPIPRALAQMIHRPFRDGTRRNVPSGLMDMKLPIHDVKSGAFGAHPLPGLAVAPGELPQKGRKGDCIAGQGL